VYPWRKRRIRDSFNRSLLSLENTLSAATTRERVIDPRLERTTRSLTLAALDLSAQSIFMHSGTGVLRQQHKKTPIAAGSFLFIEHFRGNGCCILRRRQARERVTVKDPGNLAVAVHRNADGAVEEMVRLYQDALFSYTLRLLQDRFEAQEVTQDAFIRAIRALTLRYDHEKCRCLVLRPWLFRIARNLAFSRRRLRRHAVEVALPEDSKEPVMSVASASRPDRPLEDRERHSVLEGALSRIRPEARDLILLRFTEEMSYAEIAAVVNSSESSVRGKVFRALQDLRKVLGEKRGGDAL
jgi:RNA polymerase sigma factor (sigma-70 family)